MILSILMPAYNEESTIEEILRRIQKSDIKHIKKEIVIVDDGSKDNTAKIVKRLMKKWKNIKFIQHKKNQGKGAAMRTAIKHASGDIAIVQDADLEYDPNDYWRVIEPIVNGSAQVVYGSRRLEKQHKKHSGFLFFLGGWSLTWITNILYLIRITDEATCYKAFKLNLLKSIPLACKRFEFCPEVTAKVAKRGIKIKEVPISYYPRSVEEGKKINYKDWFEAVFTLIKYRFRS